MSLGDIVSFGSEHFQDFQKKSYNNAKYYIPILYYYNLEKNLNFAIESHDIKILFFGQFHWCT